MLNLEWYRTFKVVYEVGTLSGAAQLLFISQPGVSLHLNSLESYTGYRLFERESRRVVPTDRGMLLYDYVIDALLKLEEIEKVFHGKSRTERPVISMGMCYTSFEQILEEHVSELPFNLITRFGECSQLTEDLDNGAVDFVVTSKISPHPNLSFTPFTTARILLVAGGKTDTTELEKLCAAGDLDGMNRWLAKQKWFATAAEMEHLKAYWMTNFKEIPKFNPGYVFPHFSSIIRCLKNAEGFAVMPDYICQSELDDNTIKLAWAGSRPLDNTIYFGKRKRTIYPKEIEFMENLLVKNWTSRETVS